MNAQATTEEATQKHNMRQHFTAPVQQKELEDAKIHTNTAC